MVNSVSWRHPVNLWTKVRDKIQLLSSVDAGILHLNEPGWNSEVVLAARLTNIPVALHLHNPCRITRSNLNLSIASKIFMCSAAQSEAIDNFERIKAKHVVLHNAVDIDVFARGRPIRDAIGLPADDVVIGTVAQIRHGKGIDIFLDAATQLLRGNDKLKFVIVGPPASNEQEYYKNMMGRLESAPLKGHVIYLGSRTDIPDLMASFDIFCLPTRGETFGIVVIEAMAVGVPVVASAIGGIPEIITDQTIGYTVGSLTADAFVSALQELISLGGGRKILGERGRSSLKGRFDLPHMGESLTEIYQEMLA
jgi:glycosyltransferase involved in cell wall biosynthesis